MSARPEPFGKVVRYGDGMTLRVVRVSHAVENGYGPGVFHGSPLTMLTIRLTNDTRKPVGLDNVVVQLGYGSPARVAPPVYGNGSSDFAGVLKPGSSQTATYSFAIPAPGLGHATMTVDMDSVHAAATFTGSLKN